MIEIKFRAWDKTENKLIQVSRIIFNDNDGYAIWAWRNHNFGWIDKDEFELMQYTGLHDKNGKEIYEGDIVRVGTWWLNDDEDLPKSIEEFEGTIHQVKWCGAYDYPAFDLHPNLNCDSNGLSEIFGSGEEKIEVIGNIYENLELLQKE